MFTESKWQLLKVRVIGERLIILLGNFVLYEFKVVLWYRVCSVLVLCLHTFWSMGLIMNLLCTCCISVIKKNISWNLIFCLVAYAFPLIIRLAEKTILESLNEGGILFGYVYFLDGILSSFTTSCKGR